MARGQHPVAVEPAGAQRRHDGVPDVGELAGDLEHPLVLLRVPPRPPLVVVAVLAPAGGVEPGGLDVAVRPRADPHVLPGRRDRQGADPVEAVVLDQGAVVVVVGEARPARRRR